MNFTPYCELSHDPGEPPGQQHCRCVRHREINDMLGSDY
jgi:hypothetical protein